MDQDWGRASARLREGMVVCRKGQGYACVLVGGRIGLRLHRSRGDSDVLCLRDGELHGVVFSRSIRVAYYRSWSRWTSWANRPEDSGAVRYSRVRRWVEKGQLSAVFEANRT